MTCLISHRLYITHDLIIFTTALSFSVVFSTLDSAAKCHLKLDIIYVMVARYVADTWSASLMSSKTGQ